MAKISIVEKKQVVVLKKEIYVEGTKEEWRSGLKPTASMMQTLNGGKPSNTSSPTQKRWK